MEQNERQEKKYCARLGWSLVLTLVTALLWQYASRADLDRPAAYRADGILPAGAGGVLYRRAAAGPPAVPVHPGFAAGGAGHDPALLGRWFVIGAALMWLGSLAGSWVNDLVYRIAGLQPVDSVTETLLMMPLR